jgi:hypothetical protein
MKKLIFLIITVMLSLTLSANPYFKLSSENIEAYNILSIYEKFNDNILSEINILTYLQTIKQDTIHHKKHKQRNYVDDDLYYKPSQNKSKEYAVKENKIISNDTLTWDNSDSLRFENENLDTYYTENIKDENSAPSFTKKQMNDLHFIIFYNKTNRFNFSYMNYYNDFYFSSYYYTDSYFWYDWNYDYCNPYHNSFFYSYHNYWNYNFYSYNYWYDLGYYYNFHHNYYSYNYNNFNYNKFRYNEPIKFNRRSSSSNLIRPNINRRDVYNTQINRPQNSSNNRQQNSQVSSRTEQNRRSSYAPSYDKPKVQTRPQYNNTRTSNYNPQQQTRSNYTTPSRSTTQKSTITRSYTSPSQSRTNYSSPSTQSRSSNYNSGSSNRSSSSSSSHSGGNSNRSSGGRR